MHQLKAFDILELQALGCNLSMKYALWVKFKFLDKQKPGSL